MPKLELYPYQKTSVRALTGNKHILFVTMGGGKGPMSCVWAAKRCRETGKHKVLVISTPSKVRTMDFENEFRDFTDDSESLEIEKTSWHQLHKWVKAHATDMAEYVVIADELQRSKAGASSRMGKAFLKLTSVNHDWTGYTGTPGDKWIDMYAYFQACGLVKNKTQFVRNFCFVQTFRGFPEITGYHNESVLKKWWSEISYAPDVSEMLSQLPSEQHKIVTFKKPKGYAKVLKTRCKLGFEEDDEEGFIDNASALCHYLRQLSFTPEKEQWVKDFLSDTHENAVMFFNYTATADKIEEIAKKTLPKGARVWRIDGKRHEVPTAETLGPYDIVLTQWQSGSEGLNLQMMRLWVSIEPCYSYSTSSQARGRIKRIGQKRAMTFTYLITDGIEKDVYKVLKNKGEFKASVWALGQDIKFDES